MRRRFFPVGIANQSVTYVDEVIFNGSTTVINCGDDASVQNLHEGVFTAEGYFKVTSIAAAFNLLVGKENGAGAGWSMKFVNDDTYSEALFSTTAARLQTPSGCTDWKWHHVAMTFDADKKVKMFMDGLLIGTSPAGVGTPVSDVGLQLKIGGVYPLTGRCGWVRVSNNVRYTSSFVPNSRVNPPASDANTVRLYKMDEGTGTTIIDYSPNGVNGTLVNGTWATVEYTAPDLVSGVVITFDDARDTEYTVAFPYMQSKGIKGTIYAVTNYADTENEPYLTWEQLQEIYAAGWDIGNHTADHIDMRVDQAATTANLLEAKNDLEAHGMTRASLHVAYPWGVRNATSDAGMAAAGMLTGRYANASGENVLATVDLYGLNPLQVAATGPDLDTVMANMERIAGKGLMCILMLHGITTPAVGDDITDAQFYTLIDRIVSLNMRTYTISQFYAMAMAARA